VFGDIHCERCLPMLGRAANNDHFRRMQSACHPIEFDEALEMPVIPPFALVKLLDRFDRSITWSFIESI